MNHFERSFGTVEPLHHTNMNSLAILSKAPASELVILRTAVDKFYHAVVNDLTMSRTLWIRTIKTMSEAKQLTDTIPVDADGAAERLAVVRIRKLCNSLTS
jgi:hypothetical protein